MLEKIKNPFKKNLIPNKYKKLINDINLLEQKVSSLTDFDLRAKTFELKKRYQTEQNLTTILPEAFAIVREASFRTLGLRHYDVQLIGGLTLNDGKIAEMRTGEGKTLVATLPAYLNSLTEKGVHIVTVNDYLAERDQISMGQVYSFLGLSTGLIQENMTVSERQINYDSDITYVTNSELGFDYLRDNMALNLNEVTLKPFNYCIIDEIDSILIDEAQTPLIISNNVDTSIDKFIVAAEIVEYLEVNIHFKVDEKRKNVILTQKGTLQIETILNIKDLYDLNDPWIPYIINALKAKTLFFCNVHYIIQNNQIIIVDEFTGRIMPDRRWSDGLHQAVEAKESLPIQENTQTVASITYQNFFLLYPKLSGMTGTAKTAELEFEKIYKLSVNEIPTARPVLRADLPDLVYKDQLSKWTAVAKECKIISEKGQPILIGTTTVEKSEMLAQLLQEYQLSYQLLNAKPENVRREAEIIAQAGKKGSITIATNMAGRGTDIILGGNIEFKIRKQLYTILVTNKIRNSSKTITNVFASFKNIFGLSQKSISQLIKLIYNKDFANLSETKILQILSNISQTLNFSKTYKYSISFLYNQFIIFEKKNQLIENLIVKNSGGLYVIGTERNDSRRIDNQLRGRCGRQGDPGKSRFFLSIDDNLLRRFGGSDIQSFMQTQLIEDNDPIESNLLTKSLDAAQKRVEEQSYDARKYLFDYDEVLDKQRKVVYYERRQILESNSIQTRIIAYGEQVISEIVNELLEKTIDNKELITLLENLFGTKLTLNLISKFNLNYSNFDPLELEIYLFQEFWLAYEAKSLELEIMFPGVARSVERFIILRYLDISWTEHLQKVSLLRDAVGWRGYGQRNPLFEYREEAYYLFQAISQTTRTLVLYDLLRAETDVL